MPLMSGMCVSWKMMADKNISMYCRDDKKKKKGQQAGNALALCMVNEFIRN